MIQPHGGGRVKRVTPALSVSTHLLTPFCAASLSAGPWKAMMLKGRGAHFVALWQPESIASESRQRTRKKLVTRFLCLQWAEKWNLTTTEILGKEASFYSPALPSILSHLTLSHPFHAPFTPHPLPILSGSTLPFPNSQTIGYLDFTSDNKLLPPLSSPNSTNSPSILDFK